MHTWRGGEVAAAIRNRTIVRCAGGHGWLLGDHGSGFWIGRAAIRVTLARTDRRARLSELDRRILRELDVAYRAGNAGDRALANAIIEAAHRIPAVELARVAPLVLAAAEAGDQQAVLITRRAAGHLTAALSVIRRRGAVSPIVLGGSLLTSPNPVFHAVRAALAETWPGAPVSTAGEGAAAAAWLARRQLPGKPSGALHNRLMTAQTIRRPAGVPTGG